MEVYTLDSLLRREEVIDRFESLIWTERFNAFGDFELAIRSTPESRGLLKTGTRLAMNESYRVMTVETIEDKVDTDGRQILRCKGNSIESILEDRAARSAQSGTTANPSWVFTLAPAAAMRKIVKDICVTGILNLQDKIPFIVVDVNGDPIRHPLMPASNITEPVDPIGVDLPPQSVYKAVKDISDVWTLGFRLLLNWDASQLYWDVYAGNDRTSGQTTYAPVIFAPELDNLQNTTELTTIEASKNVAYVYAPNGFQEVYPQDVPPDTDGFERRVLTVDASDITLPAGASLDAALLQRGREELAKTRAFQAFDGEINQNSQYKYQKDYFLGDLVEQRNSDGVMNQMRVTEQIFVSDNEGERSYPTLAVNQFVNTGSWLSWQANQQWIDLESDPTTWEELP